MQCPRKSGCPRECPGECLGGPRAPETLPRTVSLSRGTPIFGDALSDTPLDTSGPKGPKPPVGGWGCLNPYLRRLGVFEVP